MKYGPERIAKHAEAIWSSLKPAICNLPSEDVSSWASELSDGMGFQENEITKEALDLLQKVASQQKNGFLNLVLKDKDINCLINLFVVSGSSGSVLPHNEQKLHFVGRLFSVLAKESTALCNTVVDTLFIRLLDNLGVSANSSSKDVLAIDSNIPCQRLNFSALYLCIEILGACRELAVASVQLTSNSDFVNDAWCQTLAGCSCSLTNVLVSDLVPSTSEKYHDADISLRGKCCGFAILFCYHEIYEKKIVNIWVNVCTYPSFPKVHSIRQTFHVRPLLVPLSSQILVLRKIISKNLISPV